tara:strand:+ start:243 stop:1376 length:1134 start_codon:yes stop_codon:yes gene_type:complete
MATLIKHGNQYCSKIQKWNGIKQIATKIPLRTNIKSTAIVRHKIVEKSEKHIKEGIIIKHQFNEYFGWLNNKGTSTLKLLTLDEAVIQFLNTYKTNVANSSYKRMIISLNCVKSVWKNNSPIKHIDTEKIEDFKRYFKNKHSVSGINLNLRNIKTFLRYCVENNIISTMPQIKMLREPRKMFKYIKESIMNEIFNLESLSPFMKRAFYLYLTTGCRRSEVIEGKLEGSILNIPAHLSKSRIEKDITLNDIQAHIIKDIHIARDTHLLKGSTLITFKDKFTKAFADVCKELNIEGYSFHCLRHSFAVTQWIVSNDIYEVKNLLGHTSVKTTERYASFTLDKLRADFPSAYQVRLKVEKVRKSSINTQHFNTQIQQICS